MSDKKIDFTKCPDKCNLRDYGVYCHYECEYNNKNNMKNKKYIGINLEEILKKYIPCDKCNCNPCKCVFLKNEQVKSYLKDDIRLVKIQNFLILIATILMALIVVLFTIRAMYSIKSASASVLTTCSVPETHLNSAGWEKTMFEGGFIFYKL